VVYCYTLGVADILHWR